MIKTYSILGFAEPVSSMTHFAAAAVFLIMSGFLLWNERANLGRFSALLVFVLSCVFLLAMSGVYHLLPQGSNERLVFRHLDHAAIYALIAGTFTAVHYISFSGLARWSMIVTVWLIAATCITLKVLFFSSIPEWISLSTYLGFGWLGMMTGIALWRRHGLRYLKPLIYGGLAYTLGAVLEFAQQPILIPGVIGYHEIFHLLVILGISFHWWFICNALEREVVPVHTYNS